MTSTHHHGHGHAHGHSHHGHDHHTGIITGLALAAFAAAAGWYYLYGSHEAYKHRKQVKSWVFRFKAELLEQLNSFEELSKETYHSLVDSIGRRYHGHPHVNNEELAALTERMKAHWDDIVAHISSH